MKLSFAVSCIVLISLSWSDASAQYIGRPHRDAAIHAKNIERLQGPLIKPKESPRRRIGQLKPWNKPKSERPTVAPGEVPPSQVDFYKPLKDFYKEAWEPNEQIAAIEEANKKDALSRKEAKRQQALKEYAASWKAEREAKKEEQTHLLFSSIYAGDLDGVKLALRHGLNPNVKYQDYTPLHYAAALRKPEIITYLLDDYEVNIGTKENQYHSMLFWGAYGNHMEMVSKLLNRGADPDIRDERGVTPLRYAQSQDHKQMIRLIITYSDGK